MGQAIVQPVLMGSTALLVRPSQLHANLDIFANSQAWQIKLSQQALPAEQESTLEAKELQQQQTAEYVQPDTTALMETPSQFLVLQASI